MLRFTCGIVYLVMYREIIWPYRKRIADAVRDPRCPAIMDEYQKVCRLPGC